MRRDILQNRSRDEQNIGAFISAALKGAALSVTVSLCLAVIFAAVSSALDDPMKFIEAFALFALLFGAAFGGFFAGKLSSPTAAIISGAFYLLLIWLISLFLRGENAPSPIIQAVIYLLCMLLSFLSGLVSTKFADRKKSPAARRKRALRR